MKIRSQTKLWLSDRFLNQSNESPESKGYFSQSLKALFQGEDVFCPTCFINRELIEEKKDTYQALFYEE